MLVVKLRGLLACSDIHILFAFTGPEILSIRIASAPLLQASCSSLNPYFILSDYTTLSITIVAHESPA